MLNLMHNRHHHHPSARWAGCWCPDV